MPCWVQLSSVSTGVCLLYILFGNHTLVGGCIRYLATEHIRFCVHSFVVDGGYMEHAQGFGYLNTGCQCRQTVLIELKCIAFALPHLLYDMTCFWKRMHFLWHIARCCCVTVSGLKILSSGLSRQISASVLDNSDCGTTTFTDWQMWVSCKTHRRTLFWLWRQSNKCFWTVYKLYWDCCLEIHAFGTRKEIYFGFKSVFFYLWMWL